MGEWRRRVLGDLASIRVRRQSRIDVSTASSQASRMHPLRSLLLASSFALSGCGAGAVVTERPTAVTVAPPLPPAAGADRLTEAGSAPVAGSFRAAWPELLARLQAGEAERLVEPELGLVILDNPGAFITVTHHASYAAAAATLPRAPVIGRCALGLGELPRFDCEREAYSVEGCILTEPSSPQLVFLHDAYVRYALGPEVSVPPEARRQLASMEALATVTVTDTSRHTRWHFGDVAGRWRLLVVDRVVPCSA